MSISVLGRRTTTGLALAALMTTGLVAAPAYAADLVVTTTDDSGPGSLREALTQANASPADDRITFAPSARGTITTSGQLQATVGSGSGSLTIEGPGVDGIALMGGITNHRVFEVRGDGSSSSAFALSAVTLTRGHGGSDGGGGLRAVEADVTLQDVVVLENSAGAGGGVHSVGGLLSVRDSVFRGNTAVDGGGVFAEQLLMVDSRVTGNHVSGRGGGIAVAPSAGPAELELVGSTVDHNGAWLEGGGVALGDEGAIVSGTARTSTIANNHADERGGGVVVGAGSSWEMESATVVDNAAHRGGGLHSDGVVSLWSSVLAMNAGGDLVGGGTAVLARSLLQDSRDSTVADDGLSLRDVDPLLGELTDNGGPTPTMLPASNSPVIDAGSSTAPSDQRGSARFVGDAADMGAVEATPEERQGLPQVASIDIPRILGDVRVGERIATDGGAWSEPSVTLSYQWLADDVPIHRWATDPSFNVGRVFISDRLSVRVTATAPGFRPATRTSDLTDYPLPGTWTVKTPSRVKGATQVGNELRAVRARLSPRAQGRTFRWYVGGREVERAYNSARLTLQPWMRGKRVKVVFLYRLNGWEELRQVVRKPKRIR